jgi:hypothetical protein
VLLRVKLSVILRPFFLSSIIHHCEVRCNEKAAPHSSYIFLSVDLSKNKITRKLIYAFIACFCGLFNFHISRTGLVLLSYSSLPEVFRDFWYAVLSKNKKFRKSISLISANFHNIFSFALIVL